MRIQTGRGTIPLITLVGIWSISALNALPGLAVSPILGKLSVIFPHSTELDIQMLSSLPSLLIIPFIILSGKLTEKVNEIRLLQLGLVIFALSGILYLLSNKMWQLIAVSALMGIGSGLIVPLSTGLISRFFIGKYRTKQFGLSSAITNVTLVLATILTGYLAEVNWHLPFAVYLLPLISIVLSVYLKRSMENESAIVSKSEVKAPVTADPVTVPGKYGVDIKHLVQIMCFYGLATYLVIIVSFNLPFLMKVALSRKELWGRNVIMKLMVFTMFFSGGLIPTYMVVNGLGLVNTRLVLILLGSVSVYNMIIARTFFQNTLPEELFEAAELDGCGTARFFLQIALPLSKAIVAVIALYVAVSHWNSYFTAMIYTTNTKLYPLQLVLRDILILGQSLTNITDASELEAMAERQRIAQIIKYVVIIVSSAPAIAAYPFLQKYFVQGVMIGSVKG